MRSVALAAHEPLVIIGDIHGAAGQLKAVIADLQRIDRRAVLLGDYVNRGPDSRRVLELLIAAQSALGDRLVLLRGNHEAALLEFLTTGRAATFLRHRGATTIRSYVPDPGPDVLAHFRRDFPHDQMTLLQATSLYAEGPGLLISHAGYHPGRPFSRAEKDLTSGNWASLIQCTSPPRSLTVVGHYVQESGRPYISDHLIGLDTGCGTFLSAPLTTLLLPEREFRAYA